VVGVLFFGTPLRRAQGPYFSELSPRPRTLRRCTELAEVEVEGWTIYWHCRASRASALGKFLFWLSARGSWACRRSPPKTGYVFFTEYSVLSPI